QLADLYGAALSHWNFARKRDPGSVRIRVFNPTLEEHGWQSTHTIIEIVNDDMPFLVDSVTMEVNCHGLTMHVIMHPIVVDECLGAAAGGPRVRAPARAAGRDQGHFALHGAPSRLPRLYRGQAFQRQG